MLKGGALDNVARVFLLLLLFFILEILIVLEAKLFYFCVALAQDTLYEGIVNMLLKCLAKALSQNSCWKLKCWVEPKLCAK